MSNNKKAVVLCSGGMDSVTVLYMVAKEISPENIIVLFVDYNQKTVQKEKESSKIAADRLGTKWISFSLHNLRDITHSSLITDEAEPSHTEVQGRNTILIGIGSALAQTHSCQELYIGIQSADVIYGDAQPRYFDHMNQAMQIAYNIELKAPLLHKTKKEIVTLAQQLNIDLQLTYSCYFSTDKPCGECPSCKVRIEAVQK